MFPRHLGYEFAILAIICTVAIFLFPTARGPYSAVHGPVTTLFSLRVRVKLWLGMALAALHVLDRVRSFRFAELRAVRHRVLLLPSVFPEPIAVLRC